MATNNAINAGSSNSTYNFAGNPNGSVAGKLYDYCIDTTNSKLYYCSTAGNAASAVWTALTGGGTSPTGSMFNFQQTALTSLYSYSLSNAGWTSTALSVSITPTSSLNKILVTGVAYICLSSPQFFGLRLNRSGTIVGVCTAPTSAFKATTAGIGVTTGMQPMPFRFLDSPATTSALSYTMEAFSNVVSPITMWFNQAGNDPGSNPSFGECISTIDVCEVST